MMMPFEYSMLALMTLFFLFAWLPSSIGKARSFGGRWLMSNRTPLQGKELAPWAARTERAYSNLKDYYPGFAVVIILLGTTGRFDESTSVAALVYVVMRFAHFAFYSFGSVWGRALSYMVAMAANIFLLIKLF